METAAVDMQERHSQTRIMALAGVAARVINAGVVFLTQIFFARILGASDFGVYATANTIMLVVAGVATLGLTALPQRYIPQYEAAGDLERLRGVLRFAFRAPFIIGGLAAVAGMALVWLLRGYLSEPVALVSVLALLTVPALAALDVIEGIALARGWKLLAYGLAFVVKPVLVPLIFLGVVLCGCGIGPMTAAGSLAAATWIAALALMVGVRRRSRAEWPAGPAREEPRLWIKACLPVVLIDGAFLMTTSTDILALTVFHSDAEVGVYSAAARLVALVAFVHHGFTWASGHHFTALHQSGDRAALAEFAARTTIWTFLPSVAAAVVMAAAAPWLLMLFGKDFAGGGMVTAVLLLGLLARAAVGPAEQLLVMTDNQMACVKAYALAFLINLLFCIALVPRYGGMGAAAATAGAYAFASVIVAVEVKRRLGFHMNILQALFPARRSAHA